MSYAECNRSLPAADYDSSFCMYVEVLLSLNRPKSVDQLDSISPEDTLLLLKKRMKSLKDVPAEMQVELSLLWRTMVIMRYSVGIPGVLQSFYKGLLSTVAEVDSLALSNFNNGRTIHNDRGSIASNNLNVESSNVFGPARSNHHLSSITRMPTAQAIFSVPELAYLKEGSEFDGDDENDPLGVVQKLFNSSESFASTLPGSDRGAMYSVCLALAVKSGRLSLLLQAALLLISVENTTKQDDDSHPRCDLSNLVVIRDIVQYLSLGEESRGLSIIAALKAARSQQILPYSFPPYSSPFLRDKSTRILQLEHGYQIFGDITQQNQNSRSDETHSVCFNGNRSLGRSVNRVTLSFGKADHGKLGLGDSQVQIVRSMLSMLIEHCLLDKFCWNFFTIIIYQMVFSFIMLYCIMLYCIVLCCIVTPISKSCLTILSCLHRCIL